MDGEQTWSGLLEEYEAAELQFSILASAIADKLAGTAAFDDDLNVLLAAEERAREVVILARLRIINVWREAQEPI